MGAVWRAQGGMSIMYYVSERTHIRSRTRTRARSAPIWLTQFIIYVSAYNGNGHWQHGDFISTLTLNAFPVGRVNVRWLFMVVARAIALRQPQKESHGNKSGEGKYNTRRSVRNEHLTAFLNINKTLCTFALASRMTACVCVLSLLSVAVLCRTDPSSFIQLRKVIANKY